MVGDERVDDNTLAEAEVFGGVTSVDGVQARRKLLTIAARVDGSIDVVVREDRKRGGCVHNNVVGWSQRLQTNVVGRHLGQG